MNYILIIETILSLGKTVIDDLQVKGAAPEVIQSVQAALDAWQAVKDSPVTYDQLESLRTKKTW